jgi:hypothetical protein
MLWLHFAVSLNYCFRYLHLIIYKLNIIVTLAQVNLLEDFYLGILPQLAPCLLIKKPLQEHTALQYAHI